MKTSQRLLWIGGCCLFPVLVPVACHVFIKDMKSPKHGWMAIGAIGMAVIGVVVLVWKAFEAYSGHDVTLKNRPIDGLPATAAHISYIYGGFGPVMLYDFYVPEADFQAWAKINGWKLKAIAPRSSGIPYDIMRYDGNGTDYVTNTSVIVNGYTYEWVSSDAQDDRLG